MDKIQIQLEKDQKIFFTSDTHYGHKNVLNFCKRPYKDIKSMNEGLIENWNKIVNHNDIVFVLGDFVWFSDSRTIARISNKLNGKHIYIICGNHDKLSGFKRIDESRIHVLSDISVIYLSFFGNNRIYEIICSHYPLMTWAHREKGAINLFGHIHSGPDVDNTTDFDLPLWKGFQYDVGVDNNEYFPIEIRDIFKKLKYSFS